MSNETNETPRSPRPAWVVALVLIKNDRSGHLQIALRQGVWGARSKEESIGAATQEALDSNKGFTVQSVLATEIHLAPGGAE